MSKAFDDQAKKRFATLISRGRPPALAAEDIGFTWPTVRRHLGEDAEFREAVEQATLVVDATVQEVAFDLATDGKHPASKWRWLERRQRQEWADTRNVQHTVSGPGGGPIVLAQVVGGALREVLSDPETRAAALAMVREVPAIEATGSEV